MNRYTTIVLTFILAMSVATLAAPVRADHDATPSASPRVGMEGGHGMSGTGAAYMVIASAGDEDDHLVGGATEVAEVVEIHEIVDQAGVMEMRPLAEGLTIPANGEVVLEPGGYHVMLIGLTESLEPGMTFELTLAFARAGEVTVPVAVQPRAPSGDAVETVTLDDLSIGGAWSRPAPMLTTGAPPDATPEATPAS
jgi:copper(I)-binding protein